MPYVRKVRGVGMKPDETCFDPQRPSWLPYVIDSLTESGCKMNELFYGNKTGNTAQPGENKSITNPDGSVSVVSSADPATLANAMAACVVQAGTWDPALNVCRPSQFSKFLSDYGLYIGLGLAGVLVLPNLIGGRR